MAGGGRCLKVYAKPRDSSFPTQVDPSTLPSGRTRLREVVERAARGRRLGLRGMGSWIAEFPEGIRTAVKGEPGRIGSSHDRLHWVGGLSAKGSGSVRSGDGPLFGHK